MRLPQRFFIVSAVILAIASVRPAVAQTRTLAPAYSAAVPSPEDTANTQQQLLKLLRLSPTLTSVVAHDPSLLADQAYVSRENPELELFLAQHPEVTRNPEFYLFSRLADNRRGRDMALERAVWPDFVDRDDRRNEPSEGAVAMHELAPVVAFGAFLIAAVFIVRYVVESRRSARFYKMQSDLHMRLIDKVGTNQELAAYLESEAGRGPFACAPAALGSGGPAVPNVVGRVLTPLQIGLVLSLLGAGLMMLPRQGQEMTNLVFGVVLLMPGIGFILSAIATWVLARRLGLMPKPAGVDAAIPPDGGGRERL